MRIAFLVIGNSRRSNYVNGYNLRYGNGGGSGTDTSTILVAEYLAKQGNEVVFASEKLDDSLIQEYSKLGRKYTPGEEFYGVKYTNIDFEGIDNKEFDILVSMLWFDNYNQLPIKVTKSIIYWSHMQWMYNTNNLVEYAKNNNLSLGIVNISEWEKDRNQGLLSQMQTSYNRYCQTIIPNPVFDEVIKEVDDLKVKKKKNKFIFHALWTRGGDVAVDVVRKLDLKGKEFHAFDYLMVIHDHKDDFFYNHRGVDKKTLFTHIAESEYFIYPLYTPYKDVHKDTFACTVAEAIALGAIVITYPLGALPENFKDYCVWLDEPPGASFENMQQEQLSKDEEGIFKITDNIVEKIKFLEKNTYVKEYFKNAGRQYILDNFSVDRVGKMWVDFLEEVVNKEPLEPVTHAPIQLPPEPEKKEAPSIPRKYLVEDKQYVVDNYFNNEPALFNTYVYCSISDHIKTNKFWEPHIHEVFEKYINKDSIVVEGGSHIGSHSIKIAKLAKHLICFEPLKQSNELLRKNLKNNNCDNVTVFNTALGNKLSKSMFAWIPFGNVGASGLDDNPMGIPNNQKDLNPETDLYEVDVNTVDSLKLDRLDFLKLDVEGYETKAVEGAMDTIIRHRPIVLLESWVDHQGGSDIDHTKKEFKSLLDLGYKIKPLSTCDWLFLPYPGME